MSMLKQAIKKALFAVAPRTATAIMSARARAHSQRLVKEWGLRDLGQKLIREVGDVVLAGPFRGLRLTPMCQAEHVSPFLLGVYELELQPWWEAVFRRPFAQILDVGAKFGYYAVGLALRYPHADNVAFDTDWWARRALREMRAANRARLTIRGYCSPRWLAAHLRDGAFIICDCEGYEGELFGAADAPALATATMIIELHEAFMPGVSARIRARFAATHRIERIGSRDETPLPTVPLATLSAEEVRRASQEVRLPQEWLFLEPKAAPAANSPAPPAPGEALP
jgi:hypothetical protein